MTLRKHLWEWGHKQPPRWLGLFYSLSIVALVVVGVLIVQELQKIFP